MYIYKIKRNLFPLFLLKEKKLEIYFQILNMKNKTLIPLYNGSTYITNVTFLLSYYYSRKNTPHSCLVVLYLLRIPRVIHGMFLILYDFYSIFLIYLYHATNLLLDYNLNVLYYCGPIDIKLLYYTKLRRIYLNVIHISFCHTKKIIEF